jgi:PAS domain S-box-containing protein
MPEFSIPLDRPSILVVDDRDGVRHMISHVLTSKRYQVHLAKDGLEALALVKEELPDLILLDFHMPQMDGLQVCEHLKNNPSTSSIPIILMVGENDRFNKVRAFHLGITDYAFKPFQPEEMLLRISHQIKISRQYQQLVAQNDQLQAEIEQRQLLEAKLQSSESKLETLINTMTDLVLIIDRDLDGVNVIPTNVSTSYGEDVDIISLTIEAFDENPTRALFQQQIEACFDQGTAIEFEYALIGEIWFMASVAPFNGHQVIWTARDISSRKKIEQELTTSKDNLRTILDNIPQQVFWKDQNLVFQGCNRRWAEAIQFTHPDQVIGKTDYDLLSDPAAAELYRAKDQAVMAKNKPDSHVIDIKQHSNNGKTVWLDSHRIPINNIEGDVVGVLGVLEDITWRKEAEEAIQAEREKADRLLLNVLPEVIATRLKEGETIADYYEEITVLFTDIVSFTPRTAEMAPRAVVNLLNQIFSIFDRLSQHHGVEKIRTIGDSYFVIGGLPIERADHAAAIASMALAMQQEIQQFTWANGDPLQLRIGISTGGPVVGAVIGTHKFAYDVWGDVVNIASRMETHGTPGKIHTTASTYEHLKTNFLFEKRGTIEVKGKGPMDTYWLLGHKQ